MSSPTTEKSSSCCSSRNPRFPATPVTNTVGFAKALLRLRGWCFRRLLARYAALRRRRRSWCCRRISKIRIVQFRCSRLLEVLHRIFVALALQRVVYLFFHLIQRKHFLRHDLVNVMAARIINHLRNLTRLQLEKNRGVVLRKTIPPHLPDVRGRLTRAESGRFEAFFLELV